MKENSGSEDGVAGAWCQVRIRLLISLRAGHPTAPFLHLGVSDGGGSCGREMKHVNSEAYLLISHAVMLIYLPEAILSRDKIGSSQPASTNTSVHNPE